MRPLINDLNLETICLPRAHDAGLYEPAHYRRLGSLSTTITQEKTIFDQPTLGVRRFDLRPCIVNSNFVCGHYEYIKPAYVPGNVWDFTKTVGIDKDIFGGSIGWYSGGEGASVDDIVNQANQFTSKFPGEFIILEVSHLFNLDREVQDQELGYQMNQDEFDRLTDALAKLNELYVYQDGSKAAITKTKLNELLTPGKSCVMVLTDPASGITLGPAREGKGFRCSSLRPIEDTGVFHDKAARTHRSKMFGGSSSLLKQGLWSITDVARWLAPQKLSEALSTRPPGRCWTCLSAD
ncbi:hypothetical protein PFICI_10480 [Pestalotiopsis fici W106-1]|uniref:Uncharacterized protein n=1 Tax=Pestalotiopsis fici (strain W106-1 / CGMCC3.15140) TaxID=1229662 RepID=W3WX13_PESFW|nr:uncharacterized protein PFICI_10480 [Pestalotiopsis fici W106-1]ETS78418.1 hypothetical protein PFICI_10480 [Pestalotiopsis fici W106-1]